MNTLKLAYWAAVAGHVAVWWTLRIWAKNSRPHFNKKTQRFPPYGVQITREAKRSTPDNGSKKVLVRC